MLEKDNIGNYFFYNSKYFKKQSVSSSECEKLIIHRRYLTLKPTEELKILHLYILYIFFKNAQKRKQLFRTLVTRTKKS